ncbi:MAG TPA: ACT domain-containing protein [Candidatus Binatia bacterium]|nr:ACT domain-containing protein [Candidatus Binatia bacterium]
MSLKVTKMDVWSGEIRDRPGGLADILRQLAGTNANLEMVVARRQSDKPGTGIVFLAPVKGRKMTAAAAVAGLGPAPGVAALRVEGADRPGLGAKITGAIAEAGINLRGLSAAALGNRFAAYLAFDTPGDAEKAAKLIRAAGAATARGKKSSKR